MLSFKTQIFFLFMLLAYRGNAQEIDVLNYLYVVHLNDYNDTIEVTASIDFVYKKNGAINFDLKGSGFDGKGMQIVNLSLESEFPSITPFVHKDDKVIVKPKYLTVNDSDNILIHYKGIPADGLTISKNKYGERTFFADNWPNRAHHWLACIDKPDDKASFSFIVSAPKHYAVVSNGLKKTEVDLNDTMKMTTWTEDTPLPTKVMVIGVAKFATKVFADSPKDVPVSAWVYPQDSAKGFYDYALTTDIVKFFSDYIAPFPYKKLANVQSKTIFGGMENASCIFYAESSVTGDRSEEDLYAHEIAHQWFGDMASEKSFAHLWLSEGFATYMTDIYFEHKYGREAFLKRLQKERGEAIDFAKTSTHPVVDSTTDLMSLLNANSYQKGAWVLHMLRQEVGDSAFHKIIQAYYNKYKGSNADTRDFEAVAEKVSGKDLKPFFDQWLYQAGIPAINIFWEYTKGNVHVTPFKITNLSDYQLPIDVQFIYRNGRTERHTLSLSFPSQGTFAIPSKEKPLKVIVDDGVKLLAEVRLSEHE